MGMMVLMFENPGCGPSHPRCRDGLPGQLVKTTDAKGDSIVYAYDPDGRLLDLYSKCVEGS